ncbi:ACP S-malonyltransferase [bacterium]|nr:ACP S-malonyltransferase [bacterium]
MGFAVLFPGQGSQAVGMGADVFDARPDLLGPAADEVLGWSLRSMCLNGPEESLTLTEHAQPALFAISYVLWDEFSGMLAGRSPGAAAGHSLGEYTALAASGSLGYFEGLALVAARGKAMSDAATAEASGMAALIGADETAAEGLAAQRRSDGGRLWVANLNAPGQVVVAGGHEDIQWAVANGRDLGVRRVIPLKVAGAFHSPFMASAATALSDALAGIDFGPQRFPVWANTTARPYGDDTAMMLADQLTNPVRFGATLEGMGASGVTEFVHVGPGDVTAGLARRSVDGATTFVVSSLDDVETAAELLDGGE